MSLKLCACLVLIVVINNVDCHRKRESTIDPFFKDQITFYAHKGNSSFNYTYDTNVERQNVCDSGDLMAIIVPGWRESCETEWVVDMVSNLTLYRGGCIICMDYYAFSQNGDYFALVHQFYSISDVLVGTLRALESDGFSPDKFFMFGFSFGGHLVLNAAFEFGEKKVGEIDTCDMAGPGFDGSTRILPDPTLAAKNVQCIHTSSDKGTYTRNCHQNWNMGGCGWWQTAAGAFPKGSHGLCPYFYNSAFKNDFFAEERPNYCPVGPRGQLSYPEGLTMGYMEPRSKKAKVFGDLYANTLAEYPYNNKLMSENGISISGDISAMQRARLHVMNKKFVKFNSS